jgi:O-antigen/teichoic acid export membrane protein
VLTELALRAFHNAWIWSAASQALASGMSLVISVVAARLLGVNDFGDYVLIQAGVLVVSTLQYQLVCGPMMIVTGQRRCSPVYFGTVARAILAAALFAGATAAAYSLLIDRPAAGEMLALASFVFAAGTVAQDSAKRVLFARGRPRHAFLCEFARQALFVVLAVGAWLSVGVTTEILLACLGLSMLLPALPVLVPMLARGPRGRIHRAAADRHWRLGRWLMLVVLVSMAHEQLVTIFAGTWIGDQAAAGLRAANVLLGPLLVLMSSLENVVPRRAAERLRRGGEPALVAYLGQVLLLSEVPIIAACLVIGIFSGDLLTLLLGPGFRVFAPVATIMALGPPINIAREIGVTYLRTVNRTYGIFLAFTASAVVTLAAIYPLISAYGVAGAACAAVLGHSVSTVFVLISAWRAAAPAWRGRNTVLADRQGATDATEGDRVVGR